jgi:hypothetical protein
MEPECPSPGQQASTCLYPEPVLSNLLPNSILILSFYLSLLLSSDFFLSSFPTKIPYSPIYSIISISMPCFPIRGDRFVAGLDCTEHQWLIFYPVFVSRTLCVIAADATTFRLYHVTLSCSTSSSAFTAFPLQYLIQWLLLHEAQLDLATFKSCTTLGTLNMRVCYPYKPTTTTIPTAVRKLIAKKRKLRLGIETCSLTT